MPSTILDSAVFRDIFTTPAMRDVFSDENRVQKYLDFEAALARAQGKLGIIPKNAAAEIVRHCDAEQDRHGQAQGGDRADRLSGAARGAAAREAVQGRARRMVALGRHHPGHHRHRHHHADPRGARHRREGDRRHRRCAGRARQEIPRHADGRPQQPAAGGADHLRLQDGDPARRLRAPQAAPEGATPARAGGRIRRRRRHAVLARQGRAEGAGRTDARSSSSASPIFPGTPCATASPRSAASSAWSPAPAARSPST